MNALTSDPKAIFFAALDQPSSAERMRYLHDACGSNPQLRARVEQLLAAHDEAGQFLGGSGATINTPLPERPGTQIGPYKLLQQIGEGGMGIVHMAEQTEPVRRRVALKIIKPGMDTRQVIARFDAERQALAMMDHVNIARVLDGGATTSGRPYFVMELVHGVPITQYCDDHRLTPRERLELFIPVCQAIQHAHQKGIIHRDIKPTNVMVTLYDGRPVPKVIDFGVAKATEQTLTERTLFTQYGTMVGTLEYMSPEQAEMSALGVDTRSDIFSLGVLLYELLTGSTPLSNKRIRGAPYADILRMIKEEEPPKPSTRLSSSGEALASISAQRQTEPAKLTKLIRGELDWIVLKCLEKDRNRRYGTASGLAADVQRYLSDDPVLACPPSAAYQFRKFARRNKAALATAAALVLAALLAVLGLTSSLLVVTREQSVTKKALDETTKAKGQLADNLAIQERDGYYHSVAWAYRELASLDNLALAQDILEKCPKNQRGWEWRYLARLGRVEPIVLRHQTDITSVAFSPDGESLIAACKDGSIKIWSTTTHKVVLDLPTAHADAAASVAYHPDGKHAASAGIDRRLKVWDLTTGKAVFDEKIDVVHNIGTARVLAFSHDGRTLAACSDGSVKVWDWQRREILHDLPGDEKRSVTVAFSPDGRLATGTWTGVLKLWDVGKQGAALPSLPDHRRHPISALSFNRDGSLLASASFDRTVKMWNTATGERIHTLEHPGLVIGVAISPDGRRIASAGEDRAVRIWDAATGRELLALRGHTGICRCLAFSPNGHLLASSSQDGTIRIWDATPIKGTESQAVMTFDEHRDEVHCLAISPDGDKVVSSDFDRVVKVWNAKSRRVNFDLPNDDQMVFALAWQPDGRRIASAGTVDRLFTVKVWDAETRDEVYSLPAGPLEYLALAFSPNGKYLVTGRPIGTLQVWDAQSGQPAQPQGTLGSHDRSAIRGLAFSRDGKHLVSSADDGSVKLWDTTSMGHLDQPQQALHVFQGRVPGISVNVAFSPDGRRLAMGDYDYTVTIRDVESGLSLQTLRGHTGEAYAVAFSPDSASRWIATAGEDSTVRIWDSETGRLIRCFRGHMALVSCLAFSPQGDWLYSGSRDKTVKVWDISQLKDERP